MNNFKLNADAFDLETSIINIALAKLPDNIKIIDAVLSVKVQSVTEHSGIPVHYSPIGSSFASEGWENVDNVILSANDILKINISDELQDALLKKATHLQLRFDATNIVFAKDSESDFINIDYISLAEFQNNGSSQKISLGKSGQASVDLVTGRLSIATPIVETDNNVLPLSIWANYNSVENTKLPKDTGMPNNWHLNVSQFLIKEDNSDGNLKFTYIDENGKNQIIEEKYYYLDGNNKNYVERNKLKVDLDGNYKYENYEIKTELIAPSGLKLVSSIADVVGAELVDYEPEELINVKNQVSQYKKAIEELEFNIKTQHKLFCIYALTKQMLEKQFKLQENSIAFNESQLALQKKIELIRKKATEKNRYFRIGTNDFNDGIKVNGTSIETAEYSDYNFDDATAKNALGTSPITKTQIENLANSSFTTNAQIIEGTIVANESSFIYSLGFKSDNSDGSIANQSESVSQNKDMYCTAIDQNNFTDILQTIWKTYTNANFDLDSASLWKEFQYTINDSTKLTLSYKDLISTDVQLESTINNLIKYNKQINEYYDALKKYKHQQKLYELQVPVHYLYSDSNVIYGFGKTFDEHDNETNIYRLILVSDAYKNTIRISYNSMTSNTIQTITDSSEKNISFEYDDATGYIISIIDARERKTSFVYDDSFIKEIIHCGKSILFAYNDDYLVGVLSSDGTGAKFTYDNNQVTKIQSISIVEKIEHDVITYKSSYNEKNKNFLDCLLDDNIISFVYNNYKSTSITNSRNKKVTYLFDKYGKVRTIYENSYTGDMNEFNPDEFSTKINNYDYKNNNLNLKVSKLPYSIDYLEDVHFESDTAIVYKDALSLGSIICGLDNIPYSYPVYANYYSMSSAKNKVISSIYVSEHMIKKINKETKAIYDYVNNNLANKINCVHRSFVLSGWAKADSAFIITDEDSADFPDYITNRKFEIRAIITYKDCPIPVTYSMSFDWRNTDWQHIALPVNLELKEVVSIECVIDYSHNTGSIDFTNLELKQGDYEKTEYNSDNLPIKKSSGHSEWTTSYKYDENHNLICEIITSNTTATEYTTEYEYNKLGKLIKATDYSGIIKEYVYNDKGSIIKTLTYHKDEPANILCEEKMLDDNGNETYTLNEFGEKVSKLEYIDGTGIQSSTINNDETKTAYGYDKNDTLLQTSTTINNTENTNIYGYTLDAQTSLTHNNFDIKYSYDDQGRKTKIQIADTEYLNKIYGEFEEVTYLKTGESYKQTFDKNGNVLEVYYKPALDTNYSLIIQNIYDIYGTLIYSKDLTNGTEKIRTYSYDNFGQVISEENTQHEVSVSVVNEYDDNHSTIDHATIDIDGTKIEYDYGYSISPDSKLERITSPLGNENIYYDKLGRVNKTELSPLTKEFTYLKKGSYTSNLVSKINFATNNIVNDNLTYKYDEKGNITEIRQYNKLIARYKYDALSRIVREDNKEFSTTTTFVYDAGGNILCKKIYNFTVVENLDLEKEPQVITYTYPISGWRDQLLEFNGEKFEYDNLGNPTKYRNKTLLWSHGRQLDKFSDIAEFKYNANGIRTSKYANGFTTKYYLNGNKIIRQQDASNDMYFYYGTEGLTGFKLNGTNYYYKKNLQNDIIGIIDTNGEEIVKYVYNAWGNHKAYNAKTNDLLDISCYESYINTSNVEQFIASKNPFRYRSYYYDFETGLYYLNSRYYDPETGRFINADDINAINVTRIATNGLNLYCYCLNNPVNEVDESGYFLLWLFITAIVVGAVVGATTSIVSQGVTNGWNNINWLQVGWDALIGGISGALSVTGLGVLGMTIAGATIGFVSSVGSNLINGSDFGDFNTWLDIGISTGLGAFFGFIGGAGATNTKGIDSAVRNSSQFMKAAASYDKVLTKIANGAYKTLAGAAGARAITVTTLRNAWQTAVIHSAWKSFGIGLIYNIFSSGAAIIQSIIMKNI